MKHIYIMAVLFLIASCSREKTLFDGPDLVDLYGEFSVLEPLAVNATSIDFSTGSQAVFTAAFSKNVNWTLRITGLTSGAVKEITGFSNRLDAGNAAWNGSSTILPMFKVEACAVELSFDNEEEVFELPVSITGTKPVDGFILSDFESGINPGWGSFVQSGADMSFVIRTGSEAAEGNAYYDMGGEVSWDWLIGLLDIPATAYGATSFPLLSNPEQVYFNVLLAKQPGLSNGLVLFQFREDDNGDGVYTEGEEDMFSIEVALNDEDGWQLISASYADLVTLINGAPAPAIGNGVNEPNKLHKISILMLANPTSGYAQAWMDLMLFTENGPFQP